MTNPGKRHINEDNYLAERIGEYYVFCVADGLGGHSAGEVASSIAVVEIMENVKRKGLEGLRKGVERANEVIMNQNMRKNIDMGTTCVACLIKKGSANGYFLHVGDSRAYIFNDKNYDIIWRTKDHSLVQELVDTGTISSEEAFDHPQKNVVTQALGLKKKFEIEYVEKNLQDSTVLLCSDGLSDYVLEEDIKHIIKKYSSKSACTRLINKAIENGSTDNITVIIAKNIVDADDGE